VERTLAATLALRPVGGIADDGAVGLPGHAAGGHVGLRPHEVATLSFDRSILPRELRPFVDDDGLLARWPVKQKEGRRDR
jgi:hypothetical protein